MFTDVFGRVVYYLTELKDHGDKDNRCLIVNLCLITGVRTDYKRHMGHIAHLRKQFKSLNTYDYIITLIKRRKKTLLIS